MFDNLLYQSAASLLINDLRNNTLPSAILFSGSEASGKLTCALELARVLSCEGTVQYPKGHWMCNCPSCKKNKALDSVNLLIAGRRDCSLEILAAKKTFLEATENNSEYLSATRYLFLRSVRKLTLRFNQVFWEGDDKLNKISALVEAIDEKMELISPEKPVPEKEALEKILDEIVESCKKLEKEFLSESIPIDHIRKASFWARLKNPDGKKVLIIENVERMNESCRNALLKILEEPPEDCVFILTTSKRGAVMPTILSRVRTYHFYDRTAEQQKEVLERVFHSHSDISCITEYLYDFLPVKSEDIKKAALNFYDSVMSNRLIQVDTFVKECASFEPRLIFSQFLAGILEAQRKMSDPSHAEFEFKNIEAVRDCFNNVKIFNQSPLAALEKLYRDLASNRKIYLR